MKTTQEITAADITVTFKQEGYGRQGLYINGHHLMSVFPNFEEHFEITYIDDCFIRMNEDEQFINEEGDLIDEPEYMDCNGRTTTPYESKEQFMIDNNKDEIVELLMNNDEEE